MVPTNHQNRAIGRPWSSFFVILCGFGRMCFLMDFLLAKSWPQIAIFCGFGREESVWMLFLEGSAGEAACRGGERGGVMLRESIQLRVQHAAPRVAADLKATASAADPWGKEVAWEGMHCVKCSNEGILWSCSFWCCNRRCSFALQLVSLSLLLCSACVCVCVCM